MDYTYTYLIGTLIALTIWGIFFLIRKDTRKEMLYISIIFAILSPILEELIFLQDWWQPLTITGTPVGIEDVLFGFSVGGILAVGYSILFKHKVEVKKSAKIEKKNIHFFLLLSLSLALLFFSFFILHLNSFISTIISLIIPLGILYWRRRDLIKSSIISGLITLPCMFVLYQVVHLLSPGFFDQFWFYQNIGRIVIFKIPLEEIIWFFLAGAFIGPLYEYWQEGKLIKMKKSSK